MSTAWPGVSFTTLGRVGRATFFPARPGDGAMNRVIAIGSGLTILGVCGYGMGVVIAYPGRALSVTAVMVGIALVAISGTEANS